MNELFGWIIVTGLGLVIIGIFLLSSQISEHMRVAAQMIVNGNKQILDRLAAFTHPSPQEQPTAQPGRTIERRIYQRRDPLKQLMQAAAEGERRRSPGRRLEDMLAAHAAGYSPD
ncbi:MAG: hypothetical protein HY028_08170 [Gammaproteobacteria bacterium]|nr:hypothetical protein [Gammaproteobacteria bacterium]